MDSERKNRTIGLTVSLAIHGALIALFFFMAAWKKPNPPLPEYGIELNFGIDDAGYGDVPNPGPIEEEVAPEENLTEEVTEEIQEQIEEEQTEAEPEETIAETAPQEEGISETKEEKLPKPKEEPKPVEKAPAKPTEEKKPEVVEEKPKVNQNALMGPQGNKQNTNGDQGDEEGKVDSRALYGKQGGGANGSLDMDGWRWDFDPKPQDNSKENGKIVFEIKVDGSGELMSVRTIESTVSPGVVKIYRDEVEKLTFSPLNSGASIATVTTGRITFIIRSQ